MSNKKNDSFINDYYNKVFKFSKENIEGKDVYTILSEQSKNVIVELMKTQLKLMIISDSMKMIKTDNLNLKLKENFNLTIQYIDSICTELENILVTIFAV